MTAILKIQIILCCCTGLCALAVEPSATLFENGDVKVSRALEKPHVKGSFHEHKVNRVMVYLQAGRQRFEYQDGRKPAVFDWKAGQVVWSAPDGIHSPEIVSDEPIKYYRKKALDSVTDIIKRLPGSPAEEMMIIKPRNRRPLLNGRITYSRRAIGTELTIDEWRDKSLMEGRGARKTQEKQSNQI
jgi:hypothetical protein